MELSQLITNNSQVDDHTHLWQWHSIDDEIRLWRTLPSEGVVVDVVGACVPIVLVLDVEKGAFRPTASQRQSLLVVVKVVERGGEGGATDHVHFIGLLNIPGNEADVVLADFFLLVGFLLVPVGVLCNSAGHKKAK